MEGRDRRGSWSELQATSIDQGMSKHDKDAEVSFEVPLNLHRSQVQIKLLKPFADFDTFGALVP